VWVVAFHTIIRIAPYMKRKSRKETYRLSFGFDPAIQPRSEGWSFVLRFAFLPNRAWAHEAWVAPSGAAGKKTLPSVSDHPHVSPLAKAVKSACRRGRGRSGKWREAASLHLAGILEDALFRVRTIRVLLHMVVWDDDGGDVQVQAEEGRRRREASPVVGESIPLAAQDEASALGAIAVARGLLASDPFGLRPNEGSVDFDLLEGELSLLPPLDPARKDRRGHGDGWLLMDGCALFLSDIGTWLAGRMADLGLARRGADPALGWRALTAPPAPFSGGTRIESRRFVPLGAVDPTAARRELSKGPNGAGGAGLSCHEKLEILAEAEAACAALTGMRLDGSPAA